MDTSMLIVLAVVVIAIIAIVFVYSQKRRSEKLRSRFGPEYDRLVEEGGGRRQAEAALEERAKRVEKFQIRSLSRDEYERFARAWREEQARFVDNPSEAVLNADRLVAEVMKARGYPVGDFEQRAADISVDHAAVVRNYRVAHDIALLDQKGDANTEDLRNAMVHYRELFIDLLEERAPEHMEVRR
jgi:hypothetical protein